MYWIIWNYLDMVFEYAKADIETLRNVTGFKNVKTQLISKPDLEFDGKTLELSRLYST